MQKLDQKQVLYLCRTNPEAAAELILDLFEKIEEFEKRIKMLENQLSQNSSNSSKPPSSDGLKKQTKSLRKKNGRTVGGQKGRRGVTLRQVEKPDDIVTHSVTTCQTCHRSLKKRPIEGHEKRQVFDIPPVKIKVTEHQAEIKTCPYCSSVNKASFPLSVSQPVQYGSNIKSHAVYLTVRQHLPYKRTAELVRDFFGAEISPATIFKANKECSTLLEDPVDDIKEQITASDVVHFDESGNRCEQKNHWVHSAGTPTLTYYMIHKKRGSEAMDAAGILPTFYGRAVHDHLKSYFKYSCFHGLCNAHHLRELTFLVEREQQVWAQSMIDLLLDAKKAVDQAKASAKPCLSDEALKAFICRYRRIVHQGFNANPDLDPTRKRKKHTKAQNLLRRLRDFEEQTLAFLLDFHVPFDNNLAERDIRMVKLQQKISGCFRTKKGADTFYIIRSYISSAIKQNRNILNLLKIAFDDEPVALV
jgi:transposase